MKSTPWFPDLYRQLPSPKTPRKVPPRSPAILHSILWEVPMRKSISMARTAHGGPQQIRHKIQGLLASHRIQGTGIFTYICFIFFMVNVGKYTIHGSYGCLNDVERKICYSLPVPTKNQRNIESQPALGD